MLVTDADSPVDMKPLNSDTLEAHLELYDKKLELLVGPRITDKLV